MFRLLGAFFFFVCCALRAASLEEITEKIYPVAPNVSLSVRNTDGVIYIFGSDEPAIRVTARKRAYSKARLDGIAIEVRTEGGTASIETIFPPGPKGLSTADRSGTVDYQILVPQFCTLSQVEVANGEIVVEGLRGKSANVRLTNGRTIVRNCFCNVQLAVATGGADIFYDWWESLRFAFRVEMERGNLLALLPAAAAVRVDAVSANGNVRNEFSKESDEGESAQFHLRSASGNIQILKEK